MLTKQTIEQAQSQELADLAATEIMGWTPVECEKPPYEYYKDESGKLTPRKDWQPHLNTDKGKAQAVGLKLKYQIGDSFHENGCWSFHDNSGIVLCSEQADWQEAVMRAALLSKIGE